MLSEMQERVVGLVLRQNAEYSSDMNWRERITIDPNRRSGKPCIRGTRITVQDVLEYLAGGMTVQQVLNDFPDLTSDDIQACFAFAAEREQRIAG
jgi:uncharacterized protein (DUF433 family)